MRKALWADSEARTAYYDLLDRLRTRCTTEPVRARETPVLSRGLEVFGDDYGSSGSRSVVTQPSASVMTQIFIPVLSV